MNITNYYLNVAEKNAFRTNKDKVLNFKIQIEHVTKVPEQSIKYARAGGFLSVLVSKLSF